MTDIKTAIAHNVHVWARRFNVDAKAGDDELAFKLAPTSARRGPIAMAAIRHAQEMRVPALLGNKELTTYGWAVAYAICKLMDDPKEFVTPGGNDDCIKLVAVLQDWAVQDDYVNKFVRDHMDTITLRAWGAFHQRMEEKLVSGKSLANMIIHQARYGR